MKNIILIFSMTIFFSCNSQEKKYFEIIEEQVSLPRKESNHNKIYYKINLKNNQSVSIYPIDVSSNNENEKIQMIEELLDLKADNRICVNPVSNYNPMLSQVYTGKLKEYSIKVEALFIINQIFFDKPFNYSPMPILSEKNGSNQESIQGDLIKEAYHSYIEWIKLVKDIGFSKAKTDKIYPLKDSKVTWLYGIDN